MRGDKEIIGDTACPSCKSIGKDRTNNHLMIFKNGWKYCNKCGYKEAPEGHDTTPQEKPKPMPQKNVLGNKKKEDPKKQVEKEKEFYNVLNNLKAGDIPDRKISKKTAELFGVRLTDNGRYYPIHKKGHIVNFKKRVLPKKFFLVKDKEDDEAELFGQSSFRAGGKYIIISGGEEDAMASYEILSQKYAGMEVAHVAPVYGENMFNIGKNIDYIKSFENVYIAVDNDKAGEDFRKKLRDLIGDKAKVLKFTEKDVSDMRQKGKEREYISAFFNPQVYRPIGMITPIDVREQAILIPKYGRPFPWPTLTRATYGRRLGDGFYIGAGVKIGKSEWLNQMVAHIIRNEESKAFVAKPEELPALTVKKVAGKIYEKPFHDPDAYKEGVFSKEELEMAIDSLDDKLIMYNRYGGLEWEELKSCIRHAAVVEGVQDVFIDPITLFTDGLDPTDADTLLKQIVRDLDGMSKDLGFTFYCFCHLNNPPRGIKPYEEGGRVKSAYFANSRGMMRACQYMIGLERDKYHEDPITRNTTTMRLLEDRLFGRYVEFPVYYNPYTGSYLEQQLEVPF